MSRRDQGSQVPAPNRVEPAPMPSGTIPPAPKLTSDRPQRTAYWGTCFNEDCLTSIIIYPHPDRQTDLPPEEDWDDSRFFIDCPVCAAQMAWGGTDHPADLLKHY